MKLNFRSPYLYLSILVFIIFFIQAFVISGIIKEQVLSNRLSPGLVNLSIILGYLTIGLAALFFYKTSKEWRTIKSQLLVFLLVPLVLLPVVAFIIGMIILLPLYGLVNGAIM